MAYVLKSVTVRTDNSPEGMEKIGALWQDIMCEKLPFNFIENGVPVKGLSPISKYSAYASDEKGDYDLTVMGVPIDFFADMERKVSAGVYVKIDESGKDIFESADRAWRTVWAMSARGEIVRAFTEDYESTVPSEYTKDGKAHCYLYIAVKQSSIEEPA